MSSPSKTLCRHVRPIFLICVLGGLLHSVSVSAQTAPASARQSQDDAWWTGPMLANSAGTLPPGHFLVEPYLYDISSKHSDSYGSRTYVLYGLANRLTVGVIPVLGYNAFDTGSHGSRVGLGDWTVLAQYQLTQFHEGSWLPTISVEVQQAFPTGKYDRLGNRLADGLGSGAHTTTLQLNAQTYAWLPNGRILRMRLNLSKSFSNRATVEDASVYGTDDGFRGWAKPGDNVYAGLSWEYSLTRSWVLALDLTYSHNDSSRISGYAPVPVRLDSGSSTAFGLAPALEYSWNPNMGVLLGVRMIRGGHNSTASTTPVVALNMVF
jgi:hypothetical protein